MPTGLMENQRFAPIMRVRRERLLSLLLEHPARIVECVAPAGFGKTTLAIELGSMAPAYEKVSADAGRFVEILTREHNGAFVAILDEADKIPESEVPRIASAMEFAPPQIRIVLCSRRKTAFHDGLTTPPHDRLTLTGSELAFRAHEVVSLLEERNIGAERANDILDTTEGWPIAVLSMCHGTGVSPAFDPLNAYLVTEILNQLSTSELEALLLCSALPGLRRPELVRSLRKPSSAFDLVELQLAHYDSHGGIVIRPLLAHLAYQRCREPMNAVVSAAAAAFSTAGSSLYAAAAHLALGEVSKAEACLSVLREHPKELTRFPFASISKSARESLDANALKECPLLWTALFLERQFSEGPGALLQDARSIAQTVPASPLRNAVLALSAILATQTGAKTHADELLSLVSPSEPGGEDALFVKCAQAVLLAHTGAVEEADSIWSAVRTEFWGYYAVCTQMMAVELKSARAGSDVAGGLPLTERMCSMAEKSGSPLLTGYALSSGIFTAWLYGDDQRLQKYTSGLRLLLRRSPSCRLEALAEAFEGKDGSALAEYPIYRGWRNIVLAQTQPLSQAIDLVNESMRLADASSDGSLGLACRLILSRLLPELRRRLDDECAAIVGQPELVEKMHARFEKRLARFARLREESAVPVACVPEDPLTIDVARGSITRNGRDLQLSLKTCEVVMALAVAARPLSRDALFEQLWPGQESDAARSALKMCVHRARQQLRDVDAIVVKRGMYSLGPKVRTDAADLLSSRVRRDREVEETALLFERLSHGRPSYFSGWTWFGPHEERLVSLTADLGLQLAARALEQGDIDKALRYAAILTNLDPCDETAAELVIRAHLKRGERSQALAHYKRLLRSLRDELDVEPSAQLRGLVSAASYSQVTEM